MARSTIKALENLPGTDEYGLFFIEKVGCTKNVGCYYGIPSTGLNSPDTRVVST